MFFIDCGSVLSPLLGEIKVFAVLIDVISFAQKLHRLVDGGLRDPHAFGHLDPMHEGHFAAQKQNAFEIILFRLIALYRPLIHFFLP